MSKKIILTIALTLFFSFVFLGNALSAIYRSWNVSHASQCDVDRNGNNPEDVEFFEHGIQNYYTYAKEIFCPMQASSYHEVGDEYYDSGPEVLNGWYFCGEDNNLSTSWYNNIQVRLCYFDKNDTLPYYSCSDWVTLSNNNYSCKTSYDLPDWYGSWVNSMFLQAYLPPKYGVNYSYLTHYKVSSYMDY